MELKETLHWYMAEYNYIQKGSGKIIYKGQKELDTFKELETFLGVIQGLSEIKPKDMQQKYIDLAKKYLGPGKYPKEVLAVYKYTKTRIK